MTGSRAVEAAVRGRRPAEATALFGRLDGHERTACPVSACRALEAARRVEAPDPVQTLRRLLSCAAWIEGHAAHLRLVQIPDLLSHSGAADAAELDRGLVLRRAGLEVAAAIGDGVLRVGGPYRTAVELDLRRAERTARRRDPAIAQDRLAALRAELTHNYEPWDTGPARTGTNGPDRAARSAGPYR